MLRLHHILLRYRATTIIRALNQTTTIPHNPWNQTRGTKSLAAVAEDALTESEKQQKITEILTTTKITDLDKALRLADLKVPNTLVEQTLKTFDKAGMLGYRLFRWAEKQPGYGFNTLAAYESIVDSLTRDRRYRLVWQVVDEMKRLGILRRETFHFIIYRLARARRCDEAVEVFNDMEDKYGFSKDIKTLNLLLLTLCRRRFPRTAEELVQGLRKRKEGVQPDLESYRILLEGWAGIPCLPAVEVIFRKLPSMGFELDTGAYGIYIRALIEGGKANLALDKFREMQDKGPKPDSYIYSMMIQGLVKTQVDLALSLYKGMKNSGFLLDIDGCNALVGAFCSSGRFSDAYELLEREKAVPNARTHNLIFDSMLRYKEKDHVLSEFEKVVHSGGELDENVYLLIMRSFWADGNLDKLSTIWQLMLSKKTCPTAVGYCIMVNAFLDKKNTEKASGYFEEMLNRGIRPEHKTFDRLRKCLLKDEKVNLLGYLSRKMEALGESRTLKMDVAVQNREPKKKVMSENERDFHIPFKFHKW